MWAESYSHLKGWNVSWVQGCFTAVFSKSLWGVSPLSLQVEVRHDCDVSLGATTSAESPLPRGGGGRFWAFDLEARGLRWPLASRWRSSCCKRLS